MTKIAFIGIKSYPSAHGGMETMTESIIDSLLRIEGHPYSIYVYPLFSAPASKSLHPDLHIRNIKVKNILYLRSILGLVAVVPRLINDKPDIVHLNGIENSYIIPLLRLLGFKVVLNVRGIRWALSKWGESYFHLSNIPIVLAQLVFKVNIVLFSWFADRIVTVTDYSTRFLPYLARKKTQVIYNSLDVHRVRKTALLEQLKLPADGYVLFIGRIVPLKGLHYLIQAYRSINGVREPLIVVGSFSPTDNSYHGYLSDIAAGSDIRFAGPLYGDNKLAILSDAKLVVLPSETEGMAVTILEAALLKVPILVSNIPENGTLWGDSVHYFRSCDQQDLKSKLELLLSDENTRKEKLGVAYEIAVTKFNHGRQMELFNSLYQSIEN